MPELPEVETIARGLAVQLLGRRIAHVEPRRSDLRWPLPDDFATRLSGRCVTAVARRGKYVLLALEGGDTVLAHLGMSGRFVLTGPGQTVPAGPHDHVVFAMGDGSHVVFHDPRRFGMLDVCADAALPSHPRLARLGPDPLAPEFTPAALSDRLAGRRTSIKAALLDQGTVAGLGNIYISEALFYARISPERLAESVAGTPARRLVPAIRRVLTAAIQAGGSSLRDYVQASGELGYFQHRFAVYDRAGQACPGCRCDVAKTGGIRRLVQSNRSSFYCPQRQR